MSTPDDNIDRISHTLVNNAEYVQKKMCGCCARRVAPRFHTAGRKESGTLTMLQLLCNWMENTVPNSAKPLEIVYPGTHNSATSYMRTYNPFARWTRCQDLSVTDQLNSGVRLLDFRIADDVISREAIGFMPKVSNLKHWANEMYISHYLPSCPLKPVLDDIAKFLRENTGEILILRIEKDFDRSLSPMGIAAFAWLLEKSFGKNVIRPSELSTASVGELRKQNSRIILTSKESFIEDLQKLAREECANPLTSPTSMSNNASSQADDPRVEKWSPIEGGQNLASYARWLLERTITAKPSWSWTRGRKPEIVHNKAVGFIGTPEVKNIQSSGKLFILEAILTHELNDILRYPLSSIERKNAEMRKLYMSRFLDLLKKNGDIKAITCDFVHPDFCRQIVEVNRELFAAARSKEMRDISVATTTTS